MKRTKFMEVMFSAVEDENEALTEQVASDIEEAKQTGEVDTDEVTYVNLGMGKVLVIDNVNQEATIVEGEGEEYEMEAMPDEEIEKYLHTLDGQQQEEVHDMDTENAEDHVPSGIAGSIQDNELESNELSKNEGGASADAICPECGQDPCVCEDEREFSVSTKNTAVLRFFSDQVYYEKLMSEVLDSEETAKVGNIKIDKTDEDEVVITDLTTGDQARVAVDGDELEVEELDERNFKEFSEGEEGAENPEEYDPMFVVGLNPDSQVIVDAPVYSEEDAQELAEHLNEIGVEGVQLFETPEEARDYAHDLLSENGAVETDEPEQAEFSDRELYITRFYCDPGQEVLFSDSEEPITAFMERVYSEVEEGLTDSQDAIEDAIESGEQVEDDDLIITPIDSETAIVEDKENDEFTKATTDEDGGLELEAISEEEADELLEDVDIEGQEDEKEFSEPFTRVMYKLYAEAEDELPVTQAKIEDAIESGEQIEDEDIIITPVDSETAIIEDKANDELTKVTLDGEGVDAEEISEEEADEIFKDIDVDEESEVDEDAEEETPEEKAEKEFSEKMERYENMSTVEKFFADAAEEMVSIQVPASSIQAAVAGGSEPQAQAQPEEAAQQADTSQSVELIEDKAIAAVNSIQEAAQQAAELIQEAKQSPAPGQEDDIQEAQFSDVEQSILSDPMASWLRSI